jgi:hypothetical protein
MGTTLRSNGMVFALAALALVGAPSAAEACGGCFGPSQTVQVVTDHRMVMAIHSDETILWIRSGTRGARKTSLGCSRSAATCR